MARTYKRDKSGRFAGGGGSGGKKGGGTKAAGKGGAKKAAAKPKKKMKGTKANVTKKQKQIGRGIEAKREAIRQADPGSRGMKNRGMSKKAEAVFAKTKEGKRAKALGSMKFRQEQNREASMSTGKGNKAKRRAAAMGLKVTKRRRR